MGTLRRTGVAGRTGRSLLLSLAVAGGMCALAPLTGLPLATPAAAQGKDELLISGRGIRRSYNVLGKHVHVRGNGNRITFSGYSSLVRVTGDNNQIDADAVRFVILSGRNNTVTWKRRYNGRTPRTSLKGSGNRVREYTRP